jgi:hypothetical protein
MLLAISPYRACARLLATEARYGTDSVPAYMAAVNAVNDMSKFDLPTRQDEAAALAITGHRHDPRDVAILVIVCRRDLGGASPGS